MINGTVNEYSNLIQNIVQGGKEILCIQENKLEINSCVLAAEKMIVTKKEIKVNGNNLVTFSEVEKVIAEDEKNIFISLKNGDYIFLERV